MTTAAAAEAFVEMIVTTGVKNTVEEVVGLLKEPPLDYKADWRTVDAWYSKLTAGEQEFVHFLIRQGVVTSLFHILVDLDGDAGYHEADGKPAEFTVGLAVYRNVQKEEIEQEIRLAPPEQGENLHDIFMNRLDDSGLNAL